VGGWIRLHNQELHNIYSSPNIIRVTKTEEDDMGRLCSTHWRDFKCIQTLVWSL